MRVWVLVDTVLSNAENMGARVYSTHEKALAAEAKAIAENGDSDEYCTAIIETSIE